MKKVLICDPVAKEAVAILKGAGLEVTEKTGLKEDDLVGCIGDYHAVIVRSATKITREAAGHRPRRRRPRQHRRRLRQGTGHPRGQHPPRILRLRR